MRHRNHAAVAGRLDCVLRKVVVAPNAATIPSGLRSSFVLMHHGAMRSRDERTKYGLPPDQPAPRPLTPPWDFELQALTGLWLETKCDCGRRLYPLRLMAANLGWRRTLRQVMPRLRCKECGKRPWVPMLIEDPAAETPGRGDTGRRWQLELKG